MNHVADHTDHTDHTDHNDPGGRIAQSDRTGAQQLTLLSVPERSLTPSTAPARFQLSTATRERGLAHVAEIRRRLAESQAQRATATTDTLPPRRPRAA